MATNLNCTVSSNMSEVVITVSPGNRRRLLYAINSGTTIKVNITNVQNPPSL